jgi:unsaturated chondroitin disaccharide hydrolase
MPRRISLRKKHSFHTERLEDRHLLTAAPQAITGTLVNNKFYLEEDVDHLHLNIWNDAPAAGAGTPTQSLLIANITTVTVTGGGVNDTLTIDFTNGNPFPSSVAFTGGTGSNSLTVTGINGTAVSVGASAVIFGSMAISYTATQSITIDGGPGNDTLTQTAQPNALVIFHGGGGNDTLNINAGEYAISGNPAADSTNLTVNDNSALFFAAAVAGAGINARGLAALNIGAGATATVDTPASAAADCAVLVVGSLSLNATGILDMGANDLIVHNGNLPEITGLIVQGFGAGNWKGASGITSTAGAAIKMSALAPELNASGSTGTIMSNFDNQTVVRTDVIVKFSMFGDANLDGQVDGSDYTLIDNGFNTHATGWHSGDFNYDGVVNGDDYTLIDNVFNTHGTIDPMLYKLQNALGVAEEESDRTIGEIGTTGNYPQYTNPDGTWSWVAGSQWTAGFLPGTLWEIFQATGNPYFMTQAEKFTSPLQGDDKNLTDVGFQVYDSFYPWLQQNPSNSSSIATTLLTAAASKATQFNPIIGGYGAFEAWRPSTSGNPAANFNVLMDLIMDSNLLFWAAQNATTSTLRQTYYNEAVDNAEVEQKYLVRADGGSAQFAYFNSANGAFVDNETYEGYSNSSTWSRGEAWGIYGFTLCAKETGQADFLATAKEMANYFIAQIATTGYVPYWDFNAPVGPTDYRDTSAATVAASGLLSLSKLIVTSDPVDSAKYRSAASNILAALMTSTYMNSAATSANGLLLQGTLNEPANVGDDSSIIFGDYYFLEAMNNYIAG